MDFSWSAEQRELFDAIEAFASGELNRDLIRRDREGIFNREGWTKCAKIGIQGLTMPLEYGGLAQDPMTAVGALERFGYACRDNGLAFSVNAHMWTAAAPLSAFGTEAQKEQFLLPLCSGDKIGGNAMTEPGSGSDAYNMRTSAVRRGDRYVLNGSKTFVTNAPVADLLIVFAVTDRAKGAAGISAFIVETSMKGVTIGTHLEKMGLRTSPMAEVFFEDCEIPEQFRLGSEGAGASLFTHSMVWERGCILASAVGAMRRLLETTLKYAKSRKQGGQSIGRHQQVASKLVDMKIRLETARALLYRGAYERAQGRSAVLEASMAKLHISESWIQSCQDAVQIHGGYGYMVEYEIERELRDATASRIFSGTNEIQRNLIASLLL